MAVVVSDWAREAREEAQLKIETEAKMRGRS
jgi:hypothetical protein